MSIIKRIQKVTIFLSMNPEEGGKYQYTLSILDALEKLQNKYFVSIVYLNEDWHTIVDNKFYKSIKTNRNTITKIVRKFILIFPIGIHIWRFLSKYIDPIYSDIKSTDPDLVFYPGNDSLAYEFDFLSVIPIFDLMHRYEPNFPEVSGKISKLRDKHYNNISKYAKAILVDSNVGKKHVIESYNTDKNKIFVLPYIAPNYVRMKVDEGELLAAYHLPEKFIFYPAQFWAHKNHLNLIESINLLKGKGYLINAVFVGSEKNMLSQINKKIEELKLTEQIRILDYVSNKELVALYKKAIALVMPTFFGPTNIPQLEAFALGCPVITSNIYGIPEQVGDAALLVDPNNPEEIAEKIELIWTDKKVRYDLIRKGYKINKEYSLDSFSSKLDEIIISLLNSL